MSYRIAGVDVHKKMLAVVVSDVEVDGQYQFERRISLAAAPNNCDHWPHGWSSKANSVRHRWSSACHRSQPKRQPTSQSCRHRHR
jgi:hypothetical protein